MKTWQQKALLGVLGAGFLVCGAVAAGCQAADADEPTEQASRVVQVGSDVIRQATGVVSNVRTLTVEGSGVRVVTWDETQDGVTRPWFAIDLGTGWSEPKTTSYELALRTRKMDPSKEVQSSTVNVGGTGLHVVQYVTQPLEAYWKAIEATGGEVHQYLHGNAQIVRGDLKTIQRIARLSFVRGVTPLQAGDKVDPVLGQVQQESLGVNVVLLDPENDRARVEDHIRAMGGTIQVSDRQGILVEAEVPSKALPSLVDLPQVLWVERSTPIELDYDIANQAGGADYLVSLENARPELPGYTGIGIRGHILEGVDPNHPDLAANDFRQKPIGVDVVRPDSHGMQTYGIVFGSGAGNPRARGLLPNGQGFYTHNSAVSSGPTGGRSTLVGKLINEHKVMFQTASWGGGLVRTYTAKSAEIDALILKHDIPTTQSQSNAGSQSSRPEAWAKNIISVGALNHYGTLTPDDDKWNRSGSIGPAADGSIKPDLCFYYDKTITTTVGTGYSQSFGGTSGATPTVAGHVGLTIEMWTNGVFGNPLVPAAAGEDITAFRFKNRPHFTTTKALLVHSAKQYSFSGETHDRTRTHQGWGMPDVAGMYGRRANMIVVNETDVLRPLAKKTYTLNVPAGAPDFRATLVYADKEATVPATVHRINNLDLKVTAPGGTIYWGNNGLKAEMTSTPGGEHNVLDTVENILVANPAAGAWKVEVIADEINADTHLETAEADSDYALVVSSAPR